MNIETLTYEEARALQEAYPSFTYAALCMYRSTTDEAERERLRLRLSASIGSVDDLRELLGADSESLVDFYQDAVPSTPSTDDTISAFIDKFTPGGAPVSDYLASLETLEPADSQEPGDGAELPEAVEQTEPAESQEPERQPERQTESESTALTESFARILIKNRNYKKALEIISELNLKNSEKSIYFADQIRFLKKLIAIESADK